MFCWHKWTKWKTYIAKVTYWDGKHGEKKRQYRKCEKCGKEQDRGIM